MGLQPRSSGFLPFNQFRSRRGLFIADKNFALHPDVATTLAKIACDDNALPQGSPCSRVISNLIAHVLDIHLVRPAAKVGCVYSRYSDDLTFSTNKTFPREITPGSQDDPNVWLAGTELLEIITHSGFKVNPQKTCMQYRNSRQDVTGLVVNEKINVKREYRRTVRAMVHRLFSTRKFEICGAVIKDGKNTVEKREGKLNELHGRLGFIDEIDLYNKRAVPKKKGVANLPTKESAYRQFLIYRDFYIAKTPVILCEGKTDNVYIKHAIRRLAAQFPDLAEIDNNGQIRPRVRIYKYAKSSTARILGLNDGGTSHMADFISNYKKNTDKFNAPGLQKPLVMLLITIQVPKRYAVR
jgi:hypothetical protein